VEGSLEAGAEGWETGCKERMGHNGELQVMLKDAMIAMLRRLSTECCV
jgi:hypothetical protein